MLPLNSIVHADCLTLLKTFSDKCIDCTITDPPYSETTHKGARSTKKGKVLNAINFNSINSEDFIVLVQELMRVTKRWVIMTCDWRYMNILEELGYLVRFGIWVKPNGTPQFTGDRPSMGWEAIAILHNLGRKKWNGGGLPSTYIYNKVSPGTQEKEEHPTQKPLALIQKLVSQFTNEGEIILDPFSGSGTTAIACHNLKRNFICIEKDKYYHDQSIHRLQQVTRQRHLF